MILIVLAHPDPDSLSAAVAGAAEKTLSALGVETTTVDLYRVDGGRPFPALLETDELRRKTSLHPVVQRQMSLVERADGFVVAHPDWWGGPPAVLKGWLDRVLRPGTAYEIPEGFGHRNAVGLLAGRRALVAASGDAESPGPLEEFWTERVWGFCGVRCELIYLPRSRETPKPGRDAFVNKVADASAGAFGRSQAPGIRS